MPVFSGKYDGVKMTWESTTITLSTTRPPFPQSIYKTRQGNDAVVLKTFGKIRRGFILFDGQWEESVWDAGGRFEEGRFGLNHKNDLMKSAESK